MPDIDKLLWGAITVLWGAVAALGTMVWRALNKRIEDHDERLKAVDESIGYLRNQGHDLRNLIPNPAEIEARRRESRENFDRIFSMLREIERIQNEMAGELRARRKDREA